MVQRSVLRKTLLLLESAGVAPVDGKVQFADGPVLNEDELARALAGVIEAAVYSGVAHPTVIRKPAVPGVSRIHLSNGNVGGTQVLSHSRLSCLDIHTVVLESRGIIQQIIDSKSDLARTYEKRNQLNDMWILIAVDESVGSGGLNFSTSDSRGGYDLGVFDRAFFLKSVGKELYELCA